MTPLKPVNPTLLPTYSVITVCLNSARTIGRTIDSVFRQDPLPTQYIFVDGGSTDGTAAIINQAMERARHARLPIQFTFLEQREPPGITPAWNIAIGRCQTDLIFILNSDDWYLDHCASTVVTTMDASPQADILLATTWNYLREQSIPAGTSRNRPRWLLPILMPFVHPACFVRRQLYDRIGLFDCRYKLLADYDFLYRCCRHEVRTIVLDMPLVNFELGGRANSNRQTARHEMFAIGKRHCRVPLLPHLVFFLRAIFGK